MSEAKYVSRVRVKPVGVRRAYLPAVGGPVIFGVRSEVAEHYEVSPEVEGPHALTLAYLVAVVGG